MNTTSHLRGQYFEAEFEDGTRIRAKCSDARYTHPKRENTFLGSMPVSLVHEPGYYSLEFESCTVTLPGRPDETEDGYWLH